MEILKRFVSDRNSVRTTPPGYMVTVDSNGTLTCGGSFISASGSESGFFRCGGMVGDQPCLHIVACITDSDTQRKIRLCLMTYSKGAQLAFEEFLSRTLRPARKLDPAPIPTRLQSRFLDTTGIELAPPGWHIGLESDGEVTCNGYISRDGKRVVNPCPSDPICGHVLRVIREPGVVDSFLNAIRGDSKVWGPAALRIQAIFAMAVRGKEQETMPSTQLAPRQEDLPAIVEDGVRYPFLVKRVRNPDSKLTFVVTLVQQKPNGFLNATSCRSDGRPSLACSDFKRLSRCTHETAALRRVSSKDRKSLEDWWEREYVEQDGYLKIEAPAPAEEILVRTRATLPDDRGRSDRGRIVLVGKLPKSRKRPDRPKLDL